MPCFSSPVLLNSVLAEHVDEGYVVQSCTLLSSHDTSKEISRTSSTQDAGLAPPRNLPPSAGIDSTQQHETVVRCVVIIFCTTQAKQSRTRSCRLALPVSATVAESPDAPAKTKDGFEVSEETLSGSRKRITITAPPKTCKKAWQRMIKQARKEVKAPGYRDMKAVRMQGLKTFCCTSHLTL